MELADFDKAFEFLIKHEGGYVSDPDDPGGETKYGISKRSYPNLDIKNLTLEQAKEIYRRDWWDKMGLDEVEDQAVATKLFDIAVNVGLRRAVRLMQMAINRAGGTLKVDGVIGPKTRAAINNHPNKRHVLAEFMLMCVRYYCSIARGSKTKFLAGWLKRALDMPEA